MPLPLQPIVKRLDDDTDLFLGGRGLQACLQGPKEKMCGLNAGGKAGRAMANAESMYTNGLHCEKLAVHRDKIYA